MEKIEPQEDVQRLQNGKAGKYVLCHLSHPGRLIREVDYYIYLLRDPRDNSVRYVGRTKNPKRRYNSHLNDKYDGSYIHARRDWIDELLLMNSRPHIEVVETLSAPVDDAVISEREFRWIFHLFQQGADLTNVDCLRMPRLFAAARLSQIDFLNEPIESPVWEELALLRRADLDEWMGINRKLWEDEKKAVKAQRRKERQFKHS